MCSECSSLTTFGLVAMTLLDAEQSSHVFPSDNIFDIFCLFPAKHILNLIVRLYTDIVRHCHCIRSIPILVFGGT